MVMKSRHVFLSGDWAEVRPFAEVLATLDQQGALDALPFMPEMIQYCGQRLQVSKSAHKTCDPTGATDLRRMKDAVHLTARCDGSGHDGCEARCLLFWKTAWLKPVDGPAATRSTSPDVDADGLRWMQAATRLPPNYAGEFRYRCQVTEIVPATEAISRRSLRHFFEDVTRRNVPLPRLLWHLLRTFWKRLIAKLLKFIRPRGSATAPSSHPLHDSQAQSPIPLKTAQVLNLRPGELVQVRSEEEIKATLNRNWKNRGLVFEQEMLRYCGKTYRVLGRVNHLIDEKSGRMIRLANDCVILDGCHCAGLDNTARLFCPRSPYFYWREAWLRRVEDPKPKEDLTMAKPVCLSVRVHALSDQGGSSLSRIRGGSPSVRVDQSF
jgi:hypothetical protein